MGLTIVVGNKNLSTWSMRPWLALHHTGAPFDERIILLDKPDTRDNILRYSPAGRVPVLVDDGLAVWDSLAIIEYLNEKFPAARLWPADPAARARARSVSAEMHSGFADLRRECGMNIVARTPRAEFSPPVQKDIARLIEIWRDCRAPYGAGGPFLFGAFSAVDCMFAPVVMRFVTYGVPVQPDTRAYMDAMLAQPSVAKWVADAYVETGTPR